MLGEGFRESAVDCGPYTLAASIFICASVVRGFRRADRARFEAILRAQRALGERSREKTGGEGEIFRGREGILSRFWTREAQR